MTTATIEHKIHDSLPSGFAYANAAQAEEYTATGSVNGASKVILVRSDDEKIEEEADILQGCGPDEYPRGFYEHLAVQNTARLAVRLRPPRTLEDIESNLGRRAAEKAAEWGLSVDWYISQYNLGWQAGGRTKSPGWGAGLTNDAWDDGYLDRIADRPKWHTTWCSVHDGCEEGAEA